MDKYFDQLEAAFAGLPASEAPTVAASADWLNIAPGGTPVADLPLSYPRRLLSLSPSRPRRR